MFRGLSSSERESAEMAGRHPESSRKATVVPFRKAPHGPPEDPEGDAGWRTLLAAVADIHAIIIRGVLSGAFQKDEAGPTIAAGAALLAAHDDLDLLLRASSAFIHVYGCDPYSFATRLSRMAEDLGDCGSLSVTL
jgi:hypothetical protein